MREGDEVLIDFDEDEFEESEDFFSVEGEEQQDDGKADDEHDLSRSVKSSFTRARARSPTPLPTLTHPPARHGACPFARFSP